MEEVKMYNAVSKSELELEELLEILKRTKGKKYVEGKELFEIVKKLDNVREKAYEAFIQLLYGLVSKSIRECRLLHSCSIDKWGIGLRRQETNVRFPILGEGCSDNERFYNEYELILVVKRLWFAEIGYYDENDFKEKPLSGEREINLLRGTIENCLKQQLKEYGLNINVRVYFFDFM
jgi:hypothetical protein